MLMKLTVNKSAMLGRGLISPHVLLFTVALGVRVYRAYTHRQTDRQTDRQIYNACEFPKIPSVIRRHRNVTRNTTWSWLYLLGYAKACFLLQHWICSWECLIPARAEHLLRSCDGKFRLLWRELWIQHSVACVPSEWSNHLGSGMLTSPTLFVLHISMMLLHVLHLFYMVRHSSLGSYGL